jgi:hypothetical protein
VRLLLALAVLVGATAFAPAPFPKRRPEASIDLNGLQGTWKIVRRFQYEAGQKKEMPVNQQDSSHIRIVKDTWMPIPPDALRKRFL